MSQVSKSVVAFGFSQHLRATDFLISLFESNPQEIHFASSTSDIDVLDNFKAIALGSELDYQNDSLLPYFENAVKLGIDFVVIGIPSISLSPRWSEFLGLNPIFQKPSGEWYFKSHASKSIITSRINHEFAAVGTLTLFDLKPGTEPVFTTSIGFQDYISAAEKLYPNSKVFTLGLSPTTSSFPQDISTVVKRALKNSHDAPSNLTNQLGVGIVGYGPFGGMGHYHGRAATEVDGLDLVAVVDSDERRLKAAEQEFPNIRTYKTAEELAQDPEVDICIVATPPVSHAAISMMLLDAAKHVICEKPMCLTVDEARQLITRAKAQDKMLTINQNRRWDRDFRAISRAISSGKIGSVFNIETFVGGFEHPCRAWHSEESISGGAIYDWGSHHIDQIVQVYGGPPQKVSAIKHKRVWNDVTNDDQIRVHMLWEDGREAEFFQSDITGHRKPKYFVQGTQGTIVGNYRPVVQETVSFPFGYEEHEFHHAEAPAELKLSRYESEYGLIEESLPPEKPQQFAFHKNVANHLILGEPLSVDPIGVAGVISVLEAAQRSARNGSDYISVQEI